MVKATMPSILNTVRNIFHETIRFFRIMGWSGGAMVLGKLPLPGRPTI